MPIQRITSGILADGAIVAADIADGIVTSSKLASTLSISGNFLANNITANAKVHFADSDSSHFIAFQAPTTVSSNITFTLPAADGTSNQVIQTDGSGALSFATVSASPGGSNTQVQFNNAGAFGGISGVTTDGTRMTASTTIGVGGATPSTSGSGISFPATQSASSDANTLDDYEEGTWTATLTAGGSGTITVNNAASVNRYTKIGQLVTITAYIEVSSVSSPVGRLALGGLPFSQDSSSIGGQCAYNLGLTGSPGGFYQIISGGTTNLQLDIQTADGTNPAINGANFVTTGTAFRFIVFYRIA
jgi:hypothetical protein